MDNSGSFSFTLAGSSTAYSTFIVDPGTERTLRIEITDQLVGVKLDNAFYFSNYSINQLEQALTMYQFGTNGLEAFSVNSVKISS